MRVLSILAVSAVLVTGCSSASSVGELTPSQSSRMASEASEEASQAAEEAVQQLVTAQVAQELNTVALAVKAYTDLGSTLQGEDVNQRTLDTITTGIADAQAAADAWVSYTDGLSGAAVTPALRADIDSYNAALQGYLDAQSVSSDVWKDCLDQFGTRQFEVSTCIVTSVDSDELLDTFDDYVEALTELAAELGLPIT